MNSINSGMNVQNTQIQADKKNSAIVKNNSQESAALTDKFQPSSNEDTKFDYGSQIGKGLKVMVGGAVAVGAGIGALAFLGGNVALGVTGLVVGGFAGAAFIASKLGNMFNR